MASARVASEATRRSPARRMRRGRRGGAAIAAEEGRSESSSDLTAAEAWRRLLLGFGASHRGLGGYALGQGQRSGPT